MLRYIPLRYINIRVYGPVHRLPHRCSQVPMCEYDSHSEPTWKSNPPIRVVISSIGRVVLQQVRSCVCVCVSVCAGGRARRCKRFGGGVRGCARGGVRGRCAHTSSCLTSLCGNNSSYRTSFLLHPLAPPLSSCGEACKASDLSVCAERM